MIQIPLSNTLRMVKVATPQTFDNTLLQNMDFQFYHDRIYLQKISSSDTILIQFATDYSTITAKLYDLAGNEMADKSANITQVLSSTTFDVYNLEFTVGLSGNYYLVMDFGGGAEQYRSENFQIDGFDENKTVKIEYNTSETDGIIYDNNESFVIRLEGRLAEYQPGQRKEVYTSFEESMKNLKGYPIRFVVLEFGHIPWYMVEKLNLALNHGVFKINGVEYQTDEDMETELIRNDIDITNMYGGSVQLRQVEYEEYTQAAEDEPQETFIRLYDTNNNIRTCNDSGDRRVYS